MSRKMKRVLSLLITSVIGLSLVSCNNPLVEIPYEVEFVDNSLYGCRVDMVYHHPTSDKGVYSVKNITLRSNTLITTKEVVVAEIKITCNVTEGKDKVYFRIAPKEGNPDMFMLEFKDWEAYSNKPIYIRDELLTVYRIDYFKPNR